VTNAKESIMDDSRFPMKVTRWLESRQGFLKFELWKAESADSFLCISFFTLVFTALLPFFLNTSLAPDITRIIPGPIWTLASWLNLGVIKELIFKIIVCGGFFAQNWTRLMMILTVIIAAIYTLANIIKYRTEASRSFEKYALLLERYNKPSSRVCLIVGTESLEWSSLRNWYTKLHTSLSNFNNFKIIPISD
jgi:hypothetical protein